MSGSEDVEEAAKELRRSWDVGLGHLDDLVDTLELLGIRVGEVAVQDDFESLALRTDAGQPVIAVRRARPQRMERLVMRALAEDLVSEGRAAQVLDSTTLAQTRQGVSGWMEYLPLACVADTSVILHVVTGNLLTHLTAVSIALFVPDVVIALDNCSSRRYNIFGIFGVGQ